MADKPAKKDPYDHTATARSARRSSRIKEAGGGSVLVRFKDAETMAGLDRIVAAGVGSSRPDAILKLIAEKDEELRLAK